MNRPVAGERPTILLLGPLPPPVMGPSLATRIILGSRLGEEFDLVHLDTNTHRSLTTLGRLRPGGVLRNLGLYARMAGLLANRRPRLALVPISQTTLGFAKDAGFIFLARLAGCRVVTQLRGSDFGNWLARSWPATRLLVRLVLGRTAGVIVLGERLRPLFAAYYPPERIFVVPNGADYAIPPRRRPDDPVRLLYLGSLQRSKGIEDVVAAVAILGEALPPGSFELEVHGEWVDSRIRDRCLEIVREAKLRVRFLPPVTGIEKLQALADADIFVFPPRAPEGHPWVIVEAMAAGLPIVSTDRGAIAESVTEGLNGFLVEVACPERLAARLRELVEDRGMRREMGGAGRRRYEESFTEERMTANLACCLRALLG